MGDNYFKGMRQARKDFIAASKADIGADLSFTQSQLSAIFKNLGTTGKGLAGALTASQQRDYAAIARIVSQGKGKSEQSLNRAQNQAVSRYGSALGPDVQRSLGPAKATASATKVAATASATATNILGQSGQLALDIQQSGVLEAEAGAQYQMALALQSRYQADAATAAEMQFTIQQMRVQSKLETEQQLAIMDHQYELDKKLQDDTLGGTAKGSAQAVKDIASLMPALQNFMNEHPEATLQEAMAGVHLQPGYAGLFEEAFSRMQQQGVFDGNLPSAEVAELIVTSILVQYPKLRDRRDELEALARKAINTAWRNLSANNLDPGGGGHVGATGGMAFILQQAEERGIAPPLLQ